MIHAKTVVADGGWSKVGSTNLNFSSLSANWEIDLVVEDPDFAGRMEALFEEDLSNAREVSLVSAGAIRGVRPDRPIRTTDRRARRGVAGSGSGAGATAFRVGNAALRKGSAPLRTHEYTLAAAISATVLSFSMLALRFPRLLAWPLASVGALFGGLGIVRSFRAARSRDRDQ
jgi:cardiolipin synthase